jgi:hypothetical protein
LNESDIGRLAEKLKAIEGVNDAVIIAEDGVAYLKVDLGVVDRDRLEEYAVQG